MKSVIVAAGKVVDTEDLKISAEVAAVYAKENDESGSGSGAEAEKHIVSLRVKQFNADALPADVMNYAAIAELAGGEMIVPGINGHDDVTLEEPVAVKSDKMKAFMYKGAANVICNLRYEF